MAARSTLIFISASILHLLQLTVVKAVKCPPPVVPLNARVTFTDVTLESGSNVTFTCDDGYNLFGLDTITCSPDGKWPPITPFCAINVAYRKPANQSTFVRGGDASNANDGDAATLHEGKYCTETRREISPWWMVDLLRTYEVQVVRVVGRKCCGPMTLQDMEIRVGNSTSLQKNRLCAWQPGIVEGGTTKDFQCARPEVGRYVFIQLVGVEGALSLCEVQVFTTQEFSRERCSNQTDPAYVASFNHLCYEFQVKKGGNFNRARDYCKSRGGDLVNHVTNVTQNFLAAEMNRLRPNMNSVLLWIGMTKDPGLKVRTWKWVTGHKVMAPLWGDDQPNNYNGEQNCAVFDGGRGWLWNDVGCNLDYLLWVCQYVPATCGSPNINLNTTIKELDNRLGGVVSYSCPEDSRIVGEVNRTCLQSGFWSGSAPTCSHVQCGLPSLVDNGQLTLVDNRTTFNARAVYSCMDNYTLAGANVRRCQGDGKWEGKPPTCMINTCPDPVQILNGTIHVKGTHAGSNVTYTCHEGHHLEGQDVLTCELGGQWSGNPPSCKYVDCSLPHPLQSGTFFLPDNATTFASRVTYRCAPNHVLRGVMERTCAGSGQWTGEDPSCEIISCGEPDVHMGSYVVGYEFTVGSPVEYFCDPGHVMEGEANRTCQANGNWTGRAPKCKYVDCGRVQPIPYAVLDYVNETTHVGSMVTYSCTSTYRLLGSSPRVCRDDGKWDGATPSCEEIRCPEPSRPINSIASVSGNDRAGVGDTFKIGSTIQYRCEKGFRLQGDSDHSCQASGQWNAATPKCQYVDCLLPEKIEHGSYRLPDNATFYGSLAIYSCDDNYELVGESERSCLDSARWSGTVPVCQEVTCGPLDKPPSVDSIEVGHSVAGSVATYKCAKGQRLTGNGTRVCLTTGRWSGSAPECQWVDCGRPEAVENGRSYLPQQATTYNHTVEYHCFPGYKLKGTPRRICLESGTWNASEPTCQLDVESNSIHSRSASSQREEDVTSARSVGIAIGVGSGILLLVLIGVALLYMRMRSPKPLFSNDSSKDGGTVVTYAVRSESTSAEATG